MLIRNSELMEEENIEVVMETQKESSASIDNEQLISRKPRVRKRTSKAWEVFEILPQVEGEKEKAKCRQCNLVLVCQSKTHGTKNLLTHINNCPRRSTSDVAQMLLTRTQGSSIITRPPSFDFVKFRELLTIAIIKHNLPFTFVEYEGIRDVFKYLCEDTRFISRHTARSDVMRMFHKEKKSLKSLLSDVDGRVCFTSDLWTSINTDGFITLTAHYVDKNWVLNKKILNFCLLSTPHTGIAIYEKIYSMLEKFKKYLSSSNHILSIAVILDSRFKLQFVEYTYNILYGSSESPEIKDVRSEIYALFDLYKSNIASTSTSPCPATSYEDCFSSQVTEEIPNDFTMGFDFISGFDTQTISSVTKKSELQHYLDDELIPRTTVMDVLTFWKGAEPRYPQLSKMARDILSIPLSTVASESAFSVSGRILDQYRNSLLSDAVEALVCTRDWLFQNECIEQEEVELDVLSEVTSQESYNIED